jgi:hypothetical protein
MGSVLQEIHQGLYGRVLGDCGNRIDQDIRIGGKRKDDYNQ